MKCITSEAWCTCGSRKKNIQTSNPTPPRQPPFLSLSLSKFRFVLSFGLFEIHLSLIIICNSLRGWHGYVLKPPKLWINRKAHYYLIYILVKLSHKLYHKFDCVRCEESLVLHFITGWWSRYLYISYTNLQNIVYTCSKKSKNWPLINKKKINMTPFLIRWPSLPCVTRSREIADFFLRVI